MSTQNRSSSSPFPSCFRPTTTADHRSTVVAAPPIAGIPNLATSLYHTEMGLFALTWSRSLFGRSLHLHLLLDKSAAASDDYSGFSLHSLSSPAFQLHIKPLIFWKKIGSKKLQIDNAATKSIQIFWDLSKAKFGSGPEPQSGFYIAVVVGGQLILLVGDSEKEAYARTRAIKSEKTQSTILRREHVIGSKLYKTKAVIGDKEREITVDCRIDDNPRLYFIVDDKRVLKIKHLKWKFRGNEKIEVDGVRIQVSWDVHNWLFEDSEDGYALFVFRFEKQGSDYKEDDSFSLNRGSFKWSNQSCGFDFETKKMKKGVRRSTRSSSSSSSLSSASSNCSSVMEWASVEENELKGPCGFSLLIYAWKR